MIFQEKYFSCYILINSPYFTVWLPLLLEILINMCILIIVSVSEVINFEINDEISDENIFLHEQKSWNKNVDTLRMKSSLNMK